MQAKAFASLTGLLIKELQCEGGKSLLWFLSQMYTHSPKEFEDSIDILMEIYSEGGTNSASVVQPLSSISKNKPELLIHHVDAFMEGLDDTMRAGMTLMILKELASCKFY